MPIDYSKYPSNWKTEIRPDILRRDNNKCKFCGLINGLLIHRDKQGNPYELEMCRDAYEHYGYDYFENELSNIKPEKRHRWIKIVLTIAHLEHDITDSDYDKLAALCQRCHLKYDMPYKLEQREAKKRELHPVLF